MENLNGEVALNIATTGFSCKELLSFDQVLKKVNDELQKAKGRPFARFMTADDGWQEERFVFADVRFENEESLCRSCSKFAGIERDNDVVLCDHCHHDVQLGRELAKAAGVQFFRDGKAGKYPALGYRFSMLRPGEAPHPHAYLVNRFNDWRVEDSGPCRPRYFANHVPRFDENLCRVCDAKECREQDAAEAGNPKFFTCLAQASRGRKTLGILKADVDNLGLIFINGFPEKQGRSDKSISRISTLSRLLDTFFTGRLDHLLRTEFQDIYTVYAGGDDLLVLGPWDQTLRFALHLRQEFAAWCCGNPDFTLSAGLAVVKPRLPIYAAIGQADDLLDEAKHDKALGENEPKNQFAVLGGLFKWGKADTVMMEADKLAAWQYEGVVSMGFIRQLLHSGEMYRMFKGTGETRYLRFAPMLVYSIARNIRNSGVSVWAQTLTDLQDEKLRNLTFIANYSIHSNRS
jgi:CRISPR-associated protein Csm1